MIEYVSWATRNIRQNLFSASSRVLALSLGMIAFLFATSAAVFLRSNDTSLANADHIFAVTQQAVSLDTGFSSGVFPMTSDPVAKYMRSDFPNLQAVTRIRPAKERGLVMDGQSHFLTVLYTDSEFFKVFKLPLNRGDLGSALSAPRSAVLSEATAKSLFGDKDPIGKSIVYGGIDVTVTGVTGRLLSPSQFILFPNKFDLLISDDVGKALDPEAEEPAAWKGIGVSTFIMVSTPADIVEVNRGLSSFADRHMEKSTQIMKFGTVPLSRFQEKMLNAFIRSDKTGVSISDLILFLGSAVLLVALFNYVNLGLALASAHLREGGIHVILGATRSSMLLSQLAENVLLCGASLLVSGSGLAVFASVALSGLGLAVNPGLFLRTDFIAIVGAASFVALLVGSFFPAQLLSSELAVAAARGGKIKQKSTVFGQIVMGIQFFVASLMMLVVIVMGIQNGVLKSMASRSGGNEVIVLTTPLSALGLTLDQVAAALHDVPGVLNVAGVGTQPWSSDTQNATLLKSADSTSAGVVSFFNIIGEGYFASIGAHFAAGRDVSLLRGGDEWRESSSSGAEMNAVVDRSLASAFGWSDQQAIGKTVYRRLNNSVSPVHIVGVIEDFPQHLLGGGAVGNIYVLSPSLAKFALIRLAQPSADTEAGVVNRIHELIPQVPFHSSAEGELFVEASSTFAIAVGIIGGLSVFAVLIAVLGLSGISSHMTARRTHEIAVREILGAQDERVLGLLVWQISRPVLFAAILAWPVGYICSQAYLSLFVERASLGVAPFASSLLLTLGVAWLAVGWRMVAASRRDPAEILRYE